jgi:molybdate transport system substrate-binding protein
VAPIRVLCTIALKPPYETLVPRFEEQSGQRVETDWAGIVEMRDRMKAGASPDLVIATGALVDELAAQQKIVPGSRVHLARSSVGVAVPRGAARPEIGSGEAVKRAVLGARSVAISSGPSGDYLKEVFRGWGVADSRVVQTRSGVLVGGVLERREAEIGFQQICELRTFKGIDFVGPLPPDVQLVTEYAGGVRAQANADAKALLDFLAASPGVMKQHGLEA